MANDGDGGVVSKVKDKLILGIETEPEAVERAQPEATRGPVASAAASRLRVNCTTA